MKAGLPIASKMEQMPNFTQLIGILWLRKENIHNIGRNIFVVWPISHVTGFASLKDEFD